MRRTELIIVFLVAVLVLLTVALLTSSFSQKVAEARRPFLDTVNPMYVQVKQTMEASVPGTSFNEARWGYPSALQYAPSLPVPLDME